MAREKGIETMTSSRGMSLRVSILKPEETVSKNLLSVGKNVGGIFPVFTLTRLEKDFRVDAATVLKEPRPECHHISWF